jgi:hypothetical protein
VSPNSRGTNSRCATLIGAVYRITPGALETMSHLNRELIRVVATRDTDAIEKARDTLIDFMSEIFGLEGPAETSPQTHFAAALGNDARA